MNKITFLHLLLFFLVPLIVMAQADKSDRYERGAKLIGQVYGNPNAAADLEAALADIAPDMARFIIEFPYGDVYSRPGLDMQKREIATVAALTAMGNARPQLTTHIRASLNVGVSPNEIVETILQMALYPGFPASLNALDAAQEVFEEEGVNYDPPSIEATRNRYQEGSELIGQVYGDPDTAENLVENLGDIAPDMARFILEFPYGDVYSRPGLDMQSREIATIAALTAMGTAAPQLKTHIRASLSVGLTEEQITECLIQMALYAGFPASLNALDAAREVFAE